MRNSTPQDSLPALRRATVRWLLTLALVLSAFATLSVPTQAATINVAAGVVDVDNTDGQCSLLEAFINAANNAQTHPDCPAGEQNQVDVIQLPAGTYTFPATMPAGWTPLVNATTGPLRLVGAGAASTILDGSALSGLTLFNVDGGQLTLENLTLQRFTGASSGPIQVQNTGTLTVQSAVLRENQAPTLDGGAIWAQTGAILTISNSTFTQNTATRWGGAIYAQIVTVTISNSTFSQNAATSAGGAIYADDNTALTISNSTFSSNQAQWGGAILADPNATVTISNSTFSQNAATTSGGAAILADDNSTVTISNSTFSQNAATTSGGAIVAFTNSTVTISNSTFTQNTAPEYGGAIFAYAANLTVSGSTFGQNHADESGGAFYLRGTTVLRLTNSTLSDNRTSTTGSGSAIGIGIATNVQVDLAFVTLADHTGSPAFAAGSGASGQLRIRNTILANPQVNECGSLSALTLTLAGAVLADDTTCSGATVIPTLRATLGNLANNGGSTRTHAPLLGSPAIDAVPSGQCTDWTTTPVTTDQRNLLRPIGSRCDAGAVETNPTPDLVVTNLSTSGGPYSFTFTITVRNQGTIASSPTQVWLALGPLSGSPTHVASRPVPALAPGGQTSVSVFLTISNPTWRRALATVDPLNQVPEANESNNTLARQFR